MTSTDRTASSSMTLTDISISNLKKFCLRLNKTYGRGMFKVDHVTHRSSFWLDVHNRLARMASLSDPDRLFASNVLARVRWHELKVRGYRLASQAGRRIFDEIVEGSLPVPAKYDPERWLGVFNYALSAQGNDLDLWHLDERMRWLTWNISGFIESAPRETVTRQSALWSEMLPLAKKILIDLTHHHLALFLVKDNGATELLTVSPSFEGDIGKLRESSFYGTAATLSDDRAGGLFIWAGDLSKQVGTFSRATPSVMANLGFVDWPRRARHSAAVSGDPKALFFVSRSGQVTVLSALAPFDTRDVPDLPPGFYVWDGLVGVEGADEYRLGQFRLADIEDFGHQLADERGENWSR